MSGSLSEPRDLDAQPRSLAGTLIIGIPEGFHWRSVRCWSVGVVALLWTRARHAGSHSSAATAKSFANTSMSQRRVQDVQDRVVLQAQAVPA